MRVTTWAVVVPLCCCLVVGYACCRGLQDPVTVALYHLFGYWALLGALLVTVCGILDLLARRQAGDDDAGDVDAAAPGRGWFHRAAAAVRRRRRPTSAKIAEP